ncbi:MAG: HYR domain-containing protein, partial [Thermoanaerobaculia bacterium]|nr:HYR domain-containing protein [Thermoanaerobaculia bacterium]
LAQVTAATGKDADSTPNNGVDTDGDTLVEDDPGDEDDGDGVSVTIQAGAPKLQVLKTDALDLGPDNKLNAGDVINYAITVTNTGNVMVSNITLSDPNASGLNCSFAPPFSLSPGASVNCTASHTITQADILAGFYGNSATATGEDPNGDPVTDISDDPDNPANADQNGDGDPDDPTDTALPQQAELQVLKNDALDLGGDGVISPGDVITYTITVTNTGNVPVSGISLSDPNADPGSVSCPLTTLNPGQSMNCSATHTVTQTDIDAGAVANVASASGDDPNGDPLSDNSDDPDNPTNADPDNDGEPDDPTVTVFQQATPVVTIRFSNPHFDCSNGGVYCLDVEYKSDIPNQQVFGTNVRFFYDDDVLEFLGFSDFQGGYGPVAPNPPAITTGAPGSGPAWFTFGGPAEFVNGAIQLVNTNATPIILSTTNWTKLFQICFAVDDPNANLNNFCPSVVWDLEEDPLEGGFIIGDDGVVITVVDPDPNVDSAPTVENVLHHNWTYDGIAGTPYGFPVESSCISIRCIDVSLEKSVNLAAQVAGGQVIFTLQVNNAGPDAAENVQVTDLLPAGFTYVSDNGGGAYNSGTGLWTIGTLSGNASVSLQITATVNASGSHVNLAEVTNAVGQDADSSPNNGVDTDNDTLVEDDPGDEDDGDAASVTLLTASLSVTKTDALDLGPNAALDAGDVIHYTITVTNTGTATITNIVLNDPNASGLNCTPATPFSLAPGASATCAASHTITAFDLNNGFYSNTATAEGQDPAGQPVSDISDDPDDLTNTDTEGDNEPDDPTVTLLQANPELRVNKVDQLNVGNNGVLNPGDVINYTIVVTNTGNVTVGNIVLGDPNADPGSVSCPATNLAPGQSMTCTAVHTITQTDLDALQVVNTATATGEDPNGDPVSDISDDPNDPTNNDTEGDGEPDDPTVTSLEQPPVVTVRFSNPHFDCDNNGVYCLDVEFKSDVPNQELFGVNVRFFYDDDVLEFLDFSDFQGGYGAVAPYPPAITTGAPPTGPTLFTFGGPAEFVNGAIQLVNTNATPIILSTTDWTKIFQICFQVNDPNANLNNFCPSVVWDLEENPLNGGFLTGDDGVVITVVDPDPNIDSAPTIENVQHHNWAYDGIAGTPYGFPQEASCIAIRCIDVSLEKTVDNTAPIVGYPVVFTLTVNNAGPNPAENVAVTDLLPGGFTYVSDNGGGAYNNATGLWTIGTLNAGSTVSLQITATVNASGNYVNLAEVTNADGQDADSNPNNGVDTDNDTNVDDDPGDEDDGDGVTVNPVPQDPELQVLKTDNFSPGADGLINPGDLITYSITVTNTGNVPVSNISLSDPLADPGSLTCPLTSLNPGQSMTCSATHAITQAEIDARVVINQATATGEDPNGDPIADLSDDPDDPTNDDPEGDGEPDDPTETPLVQPPVVTVRLSNPTFDCADGGVYCLDVEFKSDVPDQEIFGVNVRFFYDDNVLEFLNFSDFQGGYGTVAPYPPAIVTGAPNSGPTWFNIGGPAEFVNGAIQLLNTNATPIILSTTDWTKIFQICFTVDKQNANLNNFCPSVIWDLEENYQNGGYITGDDGLVVTLVNPDPNEDSGPAIEQAQHHNWSYDYAAGLPFGNPEETSCIQIRCIDLSLDKSVDNTTPNIGQPVVFTIQVDNAGPDEAQDVIVADLLPNGFTYVSDNSGGDYNNLTGEWNIGSLAAGSSVTIQITATVNPGGNFINLAEVSQATGKDPDSTPGNGVDTDNDTNVDDDPGDEDDGDGVTVEPILTADLSLNKGVSVSPAPVVGATATFTIVVTNDGPANATNFSVEDVVPAGYNNITNITGGGLLAGNTITWSGLSLPVDGSLTFTFDATILAGNDHMNLAEIKTSGEPDTDSTPGNGVDTDNDGNKDDDPDDEDDGDGAVVELIFLICPNDMTVNNDVDKCGANVNWAPPSSSDNVGTTVVQVDGPMPGSFIPAGIKDTVVYVAYYNGQPVDTCSFIITVRDMQLPDSKCKDITVALDDNGQATITPAGVDGGSSDNCTEISLSIDINSFDCEDIGANTVLLTVTDKWGMTSTCAAVVTVVDDIPPTISCPTVEPVNTDPENGCNGFVTYDLPVATDNCTAACVPGNLPGYTLMGTLNGHIYYRSNNTVPDWNAANIAAIGVGGHLLTITSAAEDALFNGLTTGHWIG